MKEKTDLCEGIKRFLEQGNMGKWSIFASSFKITSMKKHLKTVAIVLLNIVVCVIVIRGFTRNSILRPYAGSAVKEAICAVLLLASLYVNYFLLYPKLYPKYPKMYWVTMCLVTIMVGVADIAIAYPYIVVCNAQVIQIVGAVTFFSTHLGLITGRDLALNCFLFLIRDRNRSRQSLEYETKIVYERVRMLDVTDKDSNIQLLTMDDIFYCEQQRNFTDIHTVKNETFTRLGSMKHLEQLFGDTDFIRITTTLLVPFQYIQSCKDNMVVMKQMPWQKVPTTFPLEARTLTEVTEKIAKVLSQREVVLDENKIQEAPTSTTARRKPASAAEEKVQEVLSFIEAHPNCNTADIMAETDFSLSTVERCLSELRRQGQIAHTGSKKSGGYSRV